MLNVPSGGGEERRSFACTVHIRWDEYSRQAACQLLPVVPILPHSRRYHILINHVFGLHRSLLGIDRLLLDPYVIYCGLARRIGRHGSRSLVLLWITGFLQMTADPNYEGFLAVDSLWAQAILVKHLAVIGMMIFGIAIQWRIQPALARLAILESKQPEFAAAERDKLTRQEIRLLRLNLICAVAVLFFTAVATAI